MNRVSRPAILKEDQDKVINIQIVPLLINQFVVKQGASAEKFSGVGRVEAKFGDK